MSRYVTSGETVLDGSGATTADLNSDWFKAVGDMVTLVVVTASSSGTSPTLDIKLQMSDDGGTSTIDAYPDTDNSETNSLPDSCTCSTTAT